MRAVSLNAGFVGMTLCVTRRRFGHRGCSTTEFVTRFFPTRVSACLIRRVAPNPRIQRSVFVNSYQQQPVCCLVFFFFFILSLSHDLMHCTLSITVGLCTPCQKSKLHQHNRFFFSWGHDPYTLACKARPSFDGCWTSLSVSLSLSLSFFESFVP